MTEFHRRMEGREEKKKEKKKKKKLPKRKRIDFQKARLLIAKQWQKLPTEEMKADDLKTLKIQDAQSNKKYEWDSGQSYIRETFNMNLPTIISDVVDFFTGSLIYILFVSEYFFFLQQA